jgi:hypothetical protein
MWIYIYIHYLETQTWVPHDFRYRILSPPAFLISRMSRKRQGLNLLWNCIKQRHRDRGLNNRQLTFGHDIAVSKCMPEPLVCGRS